MELKFRVWDNSEAAKCFYYDMDWLFKNISVIPSEIFNGNDGLLFINQWTGLQDKNGRDIYTGDIVKTDIQYTIPNTVFFEEGCYHVEINEMQFIPLHILCDGFEVEIIGNLYQTPELLNT